MVEPVHAERQRRAVPRDGPVARPVEPSVPPRFTPETLLTLQRTAGNHAVVQRMTNPEVYPQGSGSRYAKVDNLEADIAEMRGDLGLVENATLGWSDEGFALSVPTADKPILVNIGLRSLKKVDPYVPTDFALDTTRQPAIATLTVHAGVEKAALKAALTRELNEITFRVKAAAVTPGGDAAQAQRAVFAPGPTPADASVTANDRATLLALVSIWEGAGKQENAKVTAALRDAGLGDMHTLPWNDKKLVELRAAGFTDAEVTRLQANRQHRLFTQANQVPANIIFGPDQVAHLLMPEYRESLFPTQGLSGGHVESELRAFAARHERVLVLDAGTAGAYRKFHQYRWTGAPPKPTTNLPVVGQPPPPGWELATDAKGPVPKSTFTNIQVFMRDALAAFAAWIATKDPAITQKTNGDFGLTTDPAEANGQKFGGWMSYDTKAKQWTINTIFPIV